MEEVSVSFVLVHINDGRVTRLASPADDENSMINLAVVSNLSVESSRVP